MRFYSRKDVDRKSLKGARIAIVGYGSQGRAHALNLKDSGYDVIVGARKGGDSWKKAKRDGLPVAEPARAPAEADLVALLTPDLEQPAVYKEIVGSMRKGAALLFAHGLNIHFKQIKPRKDLDVVLIAPTLFVTLILGATLDTLLLFGTSFLLCHNNLLVVLLQFDGS